jgi:hypothetical protein
MNADEALAARYFDENIGPDLRQDGMPEEGVAYLRRRYITDAAASPEAARQLREIYGEAS